MSTRRCRAWPGASRSRRTGCSACSIPAQPPPGRAQSDVRRAGAGLQQYQATWGRLPQTKIPAGASLKRGSTGKRVDLLRTRLGLPAAGGYDDGCSRPCPPIRRFTALARPTESRARRRSPRSTAARPIMRAGSRSTWSAPSGFPQTRAFDRYVVVDSGAAETYLFDRDRRVDSMRVIVGSAKTKTPMMAVLMRNAKANPYWNVPPELVAITDREKGEGAGPLLLPELPLRGAVGLDRQCTSDRPQVVNWKVDRVGQVKLPTIRVRPAARAVEFDGRNEVRDAERFRHLPARHAASKEKFAGDRWISNGCVRLEDYRRFAGWVFGHVPQESSQPEQYLPLPRPFRST